MSPRRPVAEPRDQTVLLRFAATEMELLGAIAHLEGVTSNHYAYTLVVEHLRSLAEDSLVQADLANRRAYALREATATQIDRARARRSARGSVD